MTTVIGKAADRVIPDDKHEWADRLGAIGWTAKGVVYLLVAVLGAQLALSGDTKGESVSKQGALHLLASQPLGAVLLTALVVGLLAYAAYRLVSIFLPATGDDTKAWLHHAGRVGSAVLYGLVALQGIDILRSQGGGAEGQAEKTWSATLLSSTPGTVVLLGVGAAFVAFGGYQIYKGVSRSFTKKLDCSESSLLRPPVIETIGVIGLTARGIVALLIAAFIFLAVQQHDANEVRGLDETLRSVQQGTAGSVGLLVVAVGLAAYGVFALISAKCRRHEAG